MAKPATMRSIYSSHVDRVGHDPSSGDLFVQWSSGKTSVYSGVPAGEADEVMNSWSVGSALRQRIKPKYAHRYLADE